MKTGDHVRFLSSTFQRPVGTAADYIADLQANNLHGKGTRGRYGGADLNESDVVNGVLAMALDHPRGQSVATAVRRVRTMRLTGTFFNPLQNVSPEDAARHAFAAVRELNIINHKNLTVGGMLDALVRAMRSDAFTKWVNGNTFTICADIYDNGRHVSLTIDRPTSNESVVFGFDAVDAAKSSDIEKIVRINSKLLLKLADALGRLPNVNEK